MQQIAFLPEAVRPILAPPTKIPSCPRRQLVYHAGHQASLAVVRTLEAHQPPIYRGKQGLLFLRVCIPTCLNHFARRHCMKRQRGSPVIHTVITPAVSTRPTKPSTIIHVFISIPPGTGYHRFLIAFTDL